MIWSIVFVTYKHPNYKYTKCAALKFSVFVRYRLSNRHAINSSNERQM